MFENSLNYFNTKAVKCAGDVRALDNINFALETLRKYSIEKNNIKIITNIYKFLLPDDPMEWFHHITKSTIVRLNKFCKTIIYDMDSEYIDNIIYQYLRTLPQFERFYFLSVNVDKKIKFLRKILAGKIIL